MPIDRPRGRARTGQRVALAVALAVLAAVGATPAVVATVPAVAAEPPPTATSATPGHVSSAGGDVVTVRGTGLTAVTDVTVWGSGEHPVPAWTVVSDTELRLTTPRLVAGGTAVVLHTAGGSSVVTGARFVAQNITALPPARALDLTRVVPGTPHCFPVKGRHGVHAEAEAVMLNITTVSPEGHGHVVVYPDVEGNGRTPAPWASTVNFVPGADVANATFVGTTRHGDVCLLTRGAVTGLLVDVMGFQAPDGPFYLDNRPERTVDTRPGSTVGPVVGPLQPRTTYDAYTGYTDPSPSGGSPWST